MKFSFAQWFRGSVSSQLIVMPRGSHEEEIVQAGQALAYWVIKGALSFVYTGPTKVPRRRTIVRRGAPLLIVDPGTYAIYAEEGTLGLRGVRRAQG